MEKDTHCKAILEHMQKHGTIHHFEAEDLYGCTRLAARIGDLRSRGVDIRTDMTEGVNRHGRKTRYAVYSLEVDQ